MAPPTKSDGDILHLVTSGKSADDLEAIVHSWWEEPAPKVEEVNVIFFLFSSL